MCVVVCSRRRQRILRWKVLLPMFVLLILVVTLVLCTFGCHLGTTVFLVPRWEMGSHQQFPIPGWVRSGNSAKFGQREVSETVIAKYRYSAFGDKPAFQRVAPQGTSGDKPAFQQVAPQGSSSDKQAFQQVAPQGTVDKQDGNSLFGSFSFVSFFVFSSTFFLSSSF